MSVLNYKLTLAYINKYIYFKIIFQTVAKIYFKHCTHASDPTNCE